MSRGRNTQKRRNREARIRLERAWNEWAQVCPEAPEQYTDRVHIPRQIEFSPYEPCYAWCRECDQRIQRNWIFNKAGETIGTFPWRLIPYRITLL